MLPVGPKYGFGLYVHWPYCTRICPYCDFNVYAAKDRDTAPLVAAICDDIRAHKQLLPDHPALDSVFLGGGTPSLLSAVEIDRILSTADVVFGLAKGAEITIEANPNDIEVHLLSDWHSTGVNRVSLGVQSLRDEALIFLGRDHNSTSARAALDLVQAQFENHSIDLIYARPDQTLSDWQAELSEALRLGAPHLSLYELTIEERTAFGMRAARGDLRPLPDDDQADLYELTQTLCEAEGLSAYEISNHAREAEYQSVHNQIYWDSGDWIGVGPGAHGRLTINDMRYATEALRRPSDYIAAAYPNSTHLTSEDSALELLAMGLRPKRGFEIERYKTLTGQKFDPHRLAQLIASGHLRQNASHIALTSSGRLLADHISGQLIA